MRSPCHGMSEDEACRRIEVARLGRRYNSIFGLLASGALTLSVAAVLKDCLTDQNQASLLAAVSGKSVRAAREELAARFPMPDVASSIRKPPQRAAGAFRTTSPAAPTVPAQPTSTPDIAGSLLELSGPPTSTRELAGASAELSLSAGSTRDIAGALTESARHPNSTRDIAGNLCATLGARRDESRERACKEAEPPSEHDDSTRAGRAATGVAATTSRSPAPSSSERARIEPLSSARYRVQFTASLAQKQKLEFALDLMSHRNPKRDLAPVVERGLDLLIAELLRTRMGKTSRPRSGARKGRKAATKLDASSSSGTGSDVHSSMSAGSAVKAVPFSNSIMNSRWGKTAVRSRSMCACFVARTIATAPSSNTVERKSTERSQVRRIARARRPIRSASDCGSFHQPCAHCTPTTSAASAHASKSFTCKRQQMLKVYAAASVSTDLPDWHC